jgi:hypothetical protein
MAQPNVHILTTGGTIASVNGAPMIDGPQLVQAVPQLLDYADINVEEFSKIGSSKMTPTNWLQLARRINELVKEKPELSGIVDHPWHRQHGRNRLFPQSDGQNGYSRGHSRIDALFQ